MLTRRGRKNSADSPNAHGTILAGAADLGAAGRSGYAEAAVEPDGRSRRPYLQPTYSDRSWLRSWGGL